MEKKHIALLYGGTSPEHEVSVLSAKGVFCAIDGTRYDVTPIGIDRKGRWWLGQPGQAPDASTFPSAHQVMLLPGGRGEALALHQTTGQAKAIRFDVVLPILHGTGGEDGSVQGVLETANVPYVGSGILASAVCMDKQVTKALLRDAGLPIARFITATRVNAPDHAAVRNALGGSTFFIKPARLGSSIGISQVSDEASLRSALALAFELDDKVIIEERIVGREIECGVLQTGSDDLLATWPSEIAVVSNAHAFYTYEAKYKDPEAVRLDVRAEVDEECAQRVQDISRTAFRVLGCAGMARVDFFLTPSGELLINEVNTIPGFTSHSMYPRMLGEADVPYPLLLDTLLKQAFCRVSAQPASAKEPWKPGCFGSADPLSADDRGNGV